MEASNCWIDQELLETDDNELRGGENTVEYLMQDSQFTKFCHKRRKGIALQNFVQKPFQRDKRSL